MDTGTFSTSPSSRSPNTTGRGRWSGRTEDHGAATGSCPAAGNPPTGTAEQRPAFPLGQDQVGELIMAVGKRPIGATQRFVLWCMVMDHRPGVWTPWIGWHYENRSRTERIMESLRLRGLVTAVDRFTTVNG